MEELYRLIFHKIRYLYECVKKYKKIIKRSL